MEEEQDIQSDIVKQKQLRDAQENQEFDRDMDAYRRGRDLTDEQRKKVLLDNARKRQQVEQEKQLLGSRILDNIQGKIGEAGSAVMEAAQEDPDTWTDDAIRIGLGGVKNVGTVLGAPGIKQGLQLLGAPAYYVGRGLGYGLEKAGVDPRYGHIVGEVGEWFIPGYGMYKAAGKVSKYSKIAGTAALSDAAALMARQNPMIASGAGAVPPGGNISNLKARILSNFYGPESLYTKAELQSFKQSAYIHRLGRLKLGKRDYMKDFPKTLPPRGGEVILVRRKRLREADPIGIDNYQLKFVADVENALIKDAGWTKGITQTTKEFQELRSGLNRLKKEHPDRYYHALMEYGDQAYLEHKVARGQTWFWRRRERNPGFAPWAGATSRNDADNLRLLFNDSFKRLKDTTEIRLGEKMKSVTNDTLKYVVDLEDPMLNPFKSADLFKASNPGNLLIRQANTEGTIIGVIGDYMQEFYTKQFTDNFNPNLLLTDDIPIRYRAKAGETASDYRDRIFSERLELILKEKGNFTLQQIQEEVFNDMVDFYDNFSSKLGWVRKPQYISDVQKSYRLNDPRFDDAPLDTSRKQLSDDFYKRKTEQLASMQEGIRNYQTGQSTMSKKEYEQLIKLYNKVSASESPF